ncbi:hypothetical protein B566_EDAN000725 [Ephemera danica]|nr:hypothetical protein B566_EDAN000725 [Ephemera danica]
MLAPRSLTAAAPQSLELPPQSSNDGAHADTMTVQRNQKQQQGQQARSTSGHATVKRGRLGEHSRCSTASNIRVHSSVLISCADSGAVAIGVPVATVDTQVGVSGDRLEGVPEAGVAARGTCKGGQAHELKYSLTVLPRTLDQGRQDKLKAGGTRPPTLLMSSSTNVRGTTRFISPSAAPMSSLWANVAVAVGVERTLRTLPGRDGGFSSGPRMIGAT